MNPYEPPKSVLFEKEISCGYFINRRSVVLTRPEVTLPKVCVRTQATENLKEFRLALRSRKFIDLVFLLVSVVLLFGVFPVVFAFDHPLVVVGLIVVIGFLIYCLVLMSRKKSGMREVKYYVARSYLLRKKAFFMIPFFLGQMFLFWFLGLLALPFLIIVIPICFIDYNPISAGRSIDGNPSVRGFSEAFLFMINSKTDGGF